MVASLKLIELILDWQEQKQKVRSWADLQKQGIKSREGSLAIIEDGVKNPHK